MSQKVHTFAVSEQDKENMKLLEAIKAECKRTGVSFTFVCLSALRQYHEANGKK